jgi:sigma-B regulation protein RsbU (phosphoserine phosphatase)
MTERQGVRRIRLSSKLAAGLLLFGLLILASAVIIGFFTFRNDTRKLYNDHAYDIAEEAESLFTDEELYYYADLVTRNARGEVTEEELEAARNEPRYLELRRQLDELRRAMHANDIFVSVMDRETVERAVESGENQDHIAGILYITDSYVKEDESFPLGFIGEFNASFARITMQIVDSGRRADDYFISESQFGYNTSAIRPVVRDGKTVALVTVEIPMSIIRSTLKQFVLRSIGLSAVVFALIVTLVLFFARRSLTRPVLQMAQAASTFVASRQEGRELEKSPIAELSVKTGDELEVLCGSLKGMEQDLATHIENLKRITAEKERIGAELNVATQIQADMLPRIFPAFPERKEFDLYASMDPAKEVGGDFYDFFLVDDDHLCLVMADVSGKGVPAALFMVIAKTLIKNRAQLGESPAEILKNVNEQLCQGNEAELFVTVWLAVIEISTGRGLAANAGHEHPVICRAGGKFELVTYRHSPAVATMEGIRFREHPFELHPGDRLFVYTDGVPEATDAEERLLGTDRMLEALNADAEAAPDVLLGNVRRAIDGFVGEAPQFDDITMLALAYNGPEKKELTLEASADNLERALAFADAELEAAGCSAKTKMQIDVAVEEIFVNIANYAYAPDTGSVTVRAETLSDPKRIRITFADGGVPYDPLSRPDPDVTLSAEERQIGGLGIFMVKKSMDDVSYEYRDGKNILTITKNLE